MLGCNQDITLWIREKIPESGKEIFVRHVPPVKCRWKNHTERNISGAAANIYNGTVIIIPYFEGISELGIKEGDIAALGVCDVEITGDAPYTASGIKRLLAPNITTIKSVSYNFDINNTNNINNINMKGKHLRLTGN